MSAPDNMGYLPDGPVEMAFTWLKAALDCKDFHWDGDQHECASGTLEDARKYQAGVLASLADTQAEIARLRGALEPHRSGPDFYDWIADRLVHVYGESEGVDFVLTLRRRAQLGREALKDVK